MRVVFEADFGRMWSDNHTPTVYTLITNVPAAQSVASFADAHTELAKALYKKYGEAYLLSDFSKVSEEKSEELCLFYLELIPRLLKNKISYISFVCPHKSMESIPADKRAKLGNAPVGIYKNFTEALASINLKRSLHLNRKFVDIL